MKFLVCVVALLASFVSGEVDPFLKDGKDPFHPGYKKPEPKDFMVSEANVTAANKALFLLLWDALQKPRFSGESRRSAFRITQAVGKAGDMHRYLTRGEAVLLSDPNLHEESTVVVWANPDGVYDFNTVGAGARRVPQFREAVATQDPDAPAKGEFVEALKSGKTFRVWLLMSCRSCLGDGKLGTLSGGADCQDCRGTGEFLQPWVLKW